MTKADRWKLAVLCSAFIMLAGCQSWASMIGLEAYEEGGQIYFRDPKASWFTNYCVRHIEVSAYRPTSATSSSLEGTVWSAGSLSGGCMTDIPFRYGEMFDDSDPKDFTAPKPLEPGLEYEIFIERNGTAGQGRFTIEEDGTIVNL